MKWSSITQNPWNIEAIKKRGIIHGIFQEKELDLIEWIQVGKKGMGNKKITDVAPEIPQVWEIGVFPGAGHSFGNRIQKDSD